MESVSLPRELQSMLGQMDQISLQTTEQAARGSADLPYARAWDRFTRLQSRINLDVRLLSLFPFGVGAVCYLVLRIVTPEKYGDYDLLGLLAGVVLAFAALFVMSFEWLFWRSPRCHSRWPAGVKRSGVAIIAACASIRIRRSHILTKNLL